MELGMMTIDDLRCYRELEQQLIKCSRLSASELWNRLPIKNDQDREIILYSILKNLLRKSSEVPVAGFFPEWAARRLIATLKEDHEPQIYILVLGLLGKLCNTSSQMKTSLVRKGLVQLLKTLLVERCVSLIHQTASQCLVMRLAEQVTAMLLYISLGPNMCLEAMKYEAIVAPLLRLCDVKNTNVFGYSSKTRGILEELVLHKDLVGVRVKVSQDVTSEIMLNLFGEACYKLNLPQFMFSVDLYDTASEEDLCVVRELSKRELIWYKDDRAEPSEDDDWQDVYVTSVIDGQFFWALCGGEDTQSALRQISRILEESTARGGLSETAVAAGELVAAVHNQLGVIRAQVASIANDSVTCRLWSLDHGVLFDSKLQDLMPLNEDLSLLPPLTTLCSLKGAIPKPYSSKVIENALGTLCNLALDSNTARSSFMDCKAHIKLLTLMNSCSDLDLCCIVLRILSNLAREEIVRYKMGGLIQNLVNVIQKWVQRDLSPSLPHLDLALATLSNLMYDNQDAKESFISSAGPELCISLLGDAVNCHLRSASQKVLRVFIGVANINDHSHDFNRRKKTLFRDHGHLAAFGKVEEALEKADAKQRRSFEERSQNAKARIRNRMKLDSLAGGAVQRVVDLTVQADTGDDGDDDNDDRAEEKYFKQPASIVQVSPRNGRISSATDSASGTEFSEEDNRTSFYLGERLNFTQDSHHELIQAKWLQDVSATMVTKVACGILNAGRRGKIYFGIDNRMVKGVQLTRDDKDELRIGLSKAMDKLQPPLKSNYFSIKFLPVVGDKTDTYVVVVTFDPPRESTFSLHNEVFLREGKETRCLSMNEIRTRGIMMESDKCLEELESLLGERDELLRLLAKLKS